MEYRTRKLVKQLDLNPAGSLFGGRALEWCDEEAAIYSLCQLKYPTHLVTKLMSAIDFKAPAYLGDIIEIGMRTVKIGTTSITVSCSIRNKRTQQEILNIKEIVFVNLGEDGKPQAHNVYHIDPNAVVNLQSDPIFGPKGGVDSNGTQYTYTNAELNTHGLGKEKFEQDRW